MTDAALPVTQSAVESFTRRYLAAVGCDIATDEGVWEVDVPDSADLPVDGDRVTLVCEEDAEGEPEAGELLNPESPFFQQLLDIAAEHSPAGAMTITGDGEQRILPAWIEKSDLKVVDTSFTPYYDRQAIAVLFDVAIETVSEYQTDFLRAVAVDIESKEVQPHLAQTFLEQANIDGSPGTASRKKSSQQSVKESIEVAKESMQHQIQPEIDEIHNKASRSAEAELEEYRQLQEQRYTELCDDIEQVRNKIAELNDKIEADQSDRRESLRERKELRQQLEELETERNELSSQRDAGFPAKQRDIRDRHDLEVTISPETISILEFEAGELELTLTQDRDRTKITLGYGTGAGVLETANCESCDEIFQGSKAVNIKSGRLVCKACI
jgi:hypothetical protein